MLLMIIIVGIVMIVFGLPDYSNKTTGTMHQIQDDKLTEAGHFENPVRHEPNIFYVDRDVKQEGDGTSWTNASTSLSGLSWANIAGGDTVYISGGTDSLVYPPDQIANKAISGNSYLVITKGKEAGHNGEVVYAAIVSGGWGLFINTCNNIKVTGLKFECLIDTTGGYGNAWPAATIFRSSHSTNVVLDNCHLIGNGMGQPITLDYSTKIKITNNIIESLWNNTDINQDPIGIGVGSGGHTITGNILIHRMLGGVGGSFGAHGDMMQIYNEGSPERLQTTIANNLLVYIRPPGTVDASAMVYIEGSHSQRYLIYNNILLNKGYSPINDIVLTNNGGYSVSAMIYNNTILNHNASGDGSAIGNVDTLIWKNNIYYLDNTCHTPLISIGTQAYKEIDYNNWTSASPVNIMGHSWSSWQGSGYDLHGDINPVSFQNVWGTNIDDYILGEGTTSVDGGTPIPYINTDIDRVLRPQNSGWDRGAKEQ